jgi:hypothetical protein
MLESYFPNRTNNLIKQLKTAGLFPAVEAPAFAVNGITDHADTIREGQTFSITAPQGTVYYTLDAGDPVVWSANGSGTKSASALQYSKSWLPGQSFTIKARTLYNGNWSAMHDRSYYYATTSAINDISDFKPEIILNNYPNPFKDNTLIQYNIPVEGQVLIEIYDVSGRKISTLLNNFCEAGKHEITWDGSSLSSGVYICKLIISGEINHQALIKMIK